MRKQVFGYKLGRDTKQRKALFKGLMNALIIHEKIETTLAKAKSIKGPFEKLVTKAKTNDLTSRRALYSSLGLENTTSKMLDLIGPKFRERNGGYLRIVRLGIRSGDKASMVKLEFVEDIKPIVKEVVKKAEDKQTPKIKVTRKTRAPKKESTKEKNA